MTLQVVEQALDPEGVTYEQRYSVPLGGSALEFVRRPVSIQPDEGTVAYCDNGPREGVMPRRAVGVFKGGKWTRVRFEPTHYTSLANVG